jgi:hypothetical protein
MINTESTLFDKTDIKKLEKAYNATYICETSIKIHLATVPRCSEQPNRIVSITGLNITHTINDTWTDYPIAIFYSTEPHPRGSNYLGIYYYKGLLMITNAITATETIITGIKAQNGEIIYSRYRHDYRESKDGSVFIDGGRDYTRHSGGELVELKIINGELCNVSG